MMAAGANPHKAPSHEPVTSVSRPQPPKFNTWNSTALEIVRPEARRIARVLGRCSIDFSNAKLFVGPCRSRRLDALQNRGQILEVVVQARIGVGLGVVAVPTMLGPIAIVDAALVCRFQCLEPLLCEVDAVGQIIIVAIADVQMDLALELGSQCAPISVR